MTKRVVSHEIKVEKSVKIILGLLVFGVFLNVFAPSFEAKDAFAEWSSNLGTSVNPFVMEFKVKLENDRKYPLSYTGKRLGEEYWHLK